MSLAQRRTAGDAPGLVGREAEIAWLLADPQAGPVSRVLVLLGDAGVGKSALLAETARRAADRGVRVLSASGLQSESELTYAGLHQLLRPVLDGLDALPRRQADALRTAFGLGDAPPVEVDRFLVGLATLTLLAEATDRTPLLLAIDDAHTLDPASVDAIAFASRRLHAEPIRVLVATRTEEAVAGFDTAEERVVQPLDEVAAAALLDRQWPAASAGLRDRILREAEGNPLALLELATAVASDVAGGVAGGELGKDSTPAGIPTTRRLEHAFAERFRELPPETRRLLQLAAASDDRDLALVVRVAESMGLDTGGFQAAEDAGLVFVVGSEFTCRHPIVRSVIYRSAPPGVRRESHEALARGLAGQPERQAWHLAAVAQDPDSHVADLLEATARASAARGGHTAAGRALVRAAELTPPGTDRAERYAAAMDMAFASGRGAWVEELAGVVQRETADRRLRARAQLAVAHVRAVSGRGPAAIVVPAEELPEIIAELPEAGIALLALLAGIGYSTGDPVLRRRVEELVAMVPGPGTEPWRLYALAACDPVRHGPAIEPHLPDLVARTPPPEVARGIAMLLWHLDQPDLAWDVVSSCIDTIRARGQLNHLPLLLVILGFVSLWRGRWRQAQSLVAEATPLATEMRQPLILGTALALDALIAALTGDSTKTRSRASEAVATAEEAFVVAVATWARGLDALASGRPHEARAILHRLYAEDSPAAHFHVGQWAIADLVEATVRTGDAAEVVNLVVAAASAAEAGISVRARLVARRAGALLAEPGVAAALEAVLETPGAQAWPFELARTRLACGERLRRDRQVVAARPWLQLGLDTFEDLGASPWAERARAELRAAGVAQEARPRRPVDELTPQQRQIAELAAKGMSNREIGEQLFLSPRTVGFHLYNTYPKLGVSSRGQLAAVLAADHA